MVYIHIYYKILYDALIIHTPAYIYIYISGKLEISVNSEGALEILKEGLRKFIKLTKEIVGNISEVKKNVNELRDDRVSEDRDEEMNNDKMNEGMNNDKMKVEGDSFCFREGDEVEARVGGRQKWFKGKITSVNRDGTYGIIYEDGDCEAGVKSDLIRSLDNNEGKRKRNKCSFCAGVISTLWRDHKIGETVVKSLCDTCFRYRLKEITEKLSSEGEK